MENKIAIIMATIMRDEIMMKCLPSFLDKNLTLYLLEQGKMTDTKTELYEDLIKQGHHIYIINKNLGISGARNYLLDKIENESFVMICDDDVELQSNPNDILYHFDNPKIGIIGGLLINMEKRIEQHYEYVIEIKNNIYYMKIPEPGENIDLVLNFFVARKELFDDIRWDNNLHLVEHSDFFLILKQLNKWIVTYDRNLLGHHYSYAFRPPEYNKIRKAPAKYTAMFWAKWGINKQKREKYPICK
jgi:glycosyltransferase involved in cell wall biosynthesis